MTTTINGVFHLPTTCKGYVKCVLITQIHSVFRRIVDGATQHGQTTVACYYGNICLCEQNVSMTTS